MSDLVGLFNLLAPFFGMIELGILSARLARLPEGGLAWMQFFLVYLALPCLFFRLLSGKPIDELLNWSFVAVTTLSTATAFALSFWVGMRSRLRLPETIMGAVSGSYSNIGYMGPPLVVSLLGQAASAPVALIFVFDTIFLFSALPALMAIAGVETRRPLDAALHVLRKVFTHPFVLATMVGLLASALRWQPPQAIDTIVGWLSGASAPAALFLLGVTVSLRPVRRIPRAVPAFVAIKLIAHPLIVWLLLSLVGGIDPVWRQTATIMAALPPALNIFVLASQYDAGIERASACVLIGTIVSMATLTAFLWLIKTGAMPPSLF